jgi:hypothetical protein
MTATASAPPGGAHRARRSAPQTQPTIAPAPTAEATRRRAAAEEEVEEDEDDEAWSRRPAAPWLSRRACAKATRRGIAG